jgi:NADPH:quinone reductase-like Zn-dependent oxidoreductase
MYAVQLAKHAGAHVVVTASDSVMPGGVTKAYFCRSLVGGCTS